MMPSPACHDQIEPEFRGMGSVKVKLFRGIQSIRAVLYGCSAPPDSRGHERQQPLLGGPRQGRGLASPTIELPHILR